MPYKQVVNMEELYEIYRLHQSPPFGEGKTLTELAPLYGVSIQALSARLKTQKFEAYRIAMEEREHAQKRAEYYEAFKGKIPFQEGEPPREEDHLSFFKEIFKFFHGEKIDKEKIMLLLSSSTMKMFAPYLIPVAAVAGYYLAEEHVTWEREIKDKEGKVIEVKTYRPPPILHTGFLLLKALTELTEVVLVFVANLLDKQSHTNVVDRLTDWWAEHKRLTELPEEEKEAWVKDMLTHPAKAYASALESPIGLLLSRSWALKWLGAAVRG